MGMKKVEKSDTIKKIEDILGIKINNWRMLYLVKKDFAYSKLDFEDDHEKRLYHILRHILRYDKKILQYSDISTMEDYRAKVFEYGDIEFRNEFMRIHNKLTANGVKLFDIVP